MVKATNLIIKSMNIPDCFYRISVKALVLNEARDKFLITKEASGEWEMPGGGLDWGADVHEELQRELMEEMGLRASWIAKHPSYFLAGPMRRMKPAWAANVVYEATLEHFDFTPSEECVAIDWLNKENTDKFDLFPNVEVFVGMFDPKRHQKV